jgi:hypothetical protein
MRVIAYIFILLALSQNEAQEPRPSIAEVKGTGVDPRKSIPAESPNNHTLLFWALLEPYVPKNNKRRTILYIIKNTKEL